MALAGHAGRTLPGPWRVGRVAVLRPVPLDDLRVSRPLDGQRIHLGWAGESTTLCGRLPLAGPRPVEGLVDCLRCLRRPVVVARHDEQLEHLDGLIGLAGRLTGASAARFTILSRSGASGKPGAVHRARGGPSGWCEADRGLLVSNACSDGGYLRVAARDLHMALARLRPGVLGATFTLVPNGDGWLATPLGAWGRDDDLPTLSIGTSGGASVRRGDWHLHLGEDAVRLEAGDAGSEPLPSRLELTGYPEHRLSLDEPDPAPIEPSRIPQRYSRVAGAAGADAWRSLTSARLVVVGAGRGASTFLRPIVRAGVAGSIQIVDPDRMEAHNLDSLGTPDDLGRAKCEVLAEELTAVHPNITIEAVHAEVNSQRVARYVSSADLLVSCVDDAVARATCALVASSFLRTHLDIGTGVFDSDGQRDSGADVRLVGPGEGCMVCLGGLAAGGGVSERGPFPGGRLGSDPGLNHVAAGIAYRKLTAWFSDNRPPAWTQLAGDRIVTQPAPGSRPGCPVCRYRGTGWHGLQHLSRVLEAAATPNPLLGQT